MQKLTHTQKRILDKLLPPSLEKKIEDQEQLNRVCKVYRMVIEEERDPYLIQQFIICVESYLYRLLQRESKFYNSGYFKDNYKVLVNDFIEDNIDAVEDDFIAEYINSQQEIIDKTFKRYVNVEGYEALEITQFVSKGFFDNFIRGSKKKIEFLKDLIKSKENAAKGKYDNPYPYIFVSADIYNNFRTYVERHIIDAVLDYSYLKKRLLKEKLISNTTDKEFMRVIYADMKLINERDYDKFLDVGKLSSLKKSFSLGRENNFNNIFGI